jgi:hypothetical protein
MGQHYNMEVWIRYVQDNMPDSEREAVEAHLYNCDLCFEQYLQVIDKWSIPYSYSLSDDFTDRTVQLIKSIQPLLSQPNSLPSKKDYRKNTIVNYLLAAGLTIVLMFTGIFQYMTNISEKLYEHDEPLTEQIMNKTTLLFQTNYRGSGEEEQNHE